MPRPSGRGGGHSFRFEYDPATIRFGTGCVADLSTELDRLGVERPLVVTGTTVGSTPEVMDPITAGLGDLLVGTFAETTPEKRLETAVRGLDAMRRHDADGLVSVGGGSSLDIAKVIATLAADDRSPETVARELADTGSISSPADPPAPIVTVPTTLAGADLSAVAGVTATPEFTSETVRGGVSDPRLMPHVAVYDPALFATTPENILTASAMNGFDKGIESLYARNATPITDATAVRGLELLKDNLGRLGEDSIDADFLEPVVEGTILVQYGVSRPGETTLSIIHAFGHGLTRGYDVHQGVAHAIVAPHVLRYLFDAVEGRRDLLADALCDDPGPAPGEDVVDAVAQVRDALGLPSRLRAVDGPAPDAFQTVAATILDDPFLRNVPAGLGPSVTEIQRVLHDAY
jgi:alcohol dehydrogenase class IV